MNTEQLSPMTQEAAAFLAAPPFTTRGNEVYDANGDCVIVCCDEPEYGCDQFYSDRLVSADAWFICPRCGRLGQRMEEVTPKHAGL